jgi:hypothetical protein
MSLKKNKRRKLVRSTDYMAMGGADKIPVNSGKGTSRTDLMAGDYDIDGYSLDGYGGSWRGAGTTYNAAGYNYKPHPKHIGDKPIKVGKFEIFAGGMRDLTPDDIDKFDVLIPLTQDIPNMTFGHPYRILAAPLVDYGGVPDTWEVFLKELVIPLLEGGHKILAYCYGSHGRTGCFLASLISILEPETADPIEAARKRHCKKAVESLAQAKAVYALRGEELPEKWAKDFSNVTRGYSYTAGYGGNTNWGSYGGGSYERKPAEVKPVPETASGIAGKTVKEVAAMNDADWAAYAKESNIPIFD